MISSFEYSKAYMCMTHDVDALRLLNTFYYRLQSHAIYINTTAPFL